MYVNALKAELALIDHLFAAMVTMVCFKIRGKVKDKREIHHYVQITIEAARLLFKRFHSFF